MTPDLERSTFQSRPAYRYIRAADKLPSTDEAIAAGGEAVVAIHLFCGAGDWYISGYDPETRLATGMACISDLDIGDFGMADLVDLRVPLMPGGRGILPVERDLYWTPRTTRELLRELTHSGDYESEAAS